MNKTIIILPVLVLVVIFGAVFSILVPNFFKKCSEYGGFVGIIKTCDCKGFEISHPLDLLNKNEIPGGSSTMCIGIQSEESDYSETNSEINNPISDDITGRYSKPTDRMTVFYFDVMENGKCKLISGIFNSPTTSNCSYTVKDKNMTVTFDSDEVWEFKVGAGKLTQTNASEDEVFNVLTKSSNDY